MIFDKYLGIAERFVPEFRDSAALAKLFIFDMAPHEHLPKVTPDWFDPDLFTLPFQVTAVEDKASCIIFEDSVADQIGFEDFRVVTEVMSPSLAEGACNSSEEIVAYNREMRRLGVWHKDLFHVFIGGLRKVLFEGEEIGMEYLLLRFLIINRDRIVSDLKRENMTLADINSLEPPCRRNAQTAVEELLQLSHPKFFVVEEAPVREPKKTKKIPRSHERPIYTLITATDFRKKVGMKTPVEEGTGRIVTPHERRRHLRRLSVESGFKENRVVPVRACFVGDSEKVIGNKRYKVMLDI